MKNVFQNVIALVVLGIVAFVFRNSLEKSFFVLQDKYFPCSRVMTYSIGSFDDTFGVSKEDFLSVIKQDEDMWETSIGKNLLEYIPAGGELKISLLYDKRQASTDKLAAMGNILESDKNNYNNLKSELSKLQIEYKEKKAIFDSRKSSFDVRQSKYQKDIAYWNSRGGATKEVVVSANLEKKSLESDLSEINILRQELNTYIEKINFSINELNKIAVSFNNKAKEYNITGDELGDEFEEGQYLSDKTGKYINIYQFDSKDNLTRVLMHELGHALGLEHLDNPDAIMYRLNIGNGLIPTEDDINALRAYCRLSKIN